MCSFEHFYCFYPSSSSFDKSFNWIFPWYREKKKLHILAGKVLLHWLRVREKNVGFSAGSKNMKYFHLHFNDSSNSGAQFVDIRPRRLAIWPECWLLRVWYWKAQRAWAKVAYMSTLRPTLEYPTLYTNNRRPIGYSSFFSRPSRCDTAETTTFFDKSFFL